VQVLTKSAASPVHRPEVGKFPAFIVHRIIDRSPAARYIGGWRKRAAVFLIRY
jgi:hypothetical protein